MSRKYILHVAFAVLLSGAASGYYGFSGDPAHREKWVESTIVPLNSHAFRMRQPDGVERMLLRDPAHPEELAGPSPWVGEVRGSKIMVMTHPDFTGGRTGFLFERGVLKTMLLGDKEYNVSGGTPVCSKLDDLWPKISDEMIKQITEQHRVRWTGRLRLWYANPNQTAILFVELLLLLVSVFLLRGRPVLKLLSLPLLLLCFYGLVRTSSRGGMVALMAGCACFAAFRFKLFLNARNLLFVLAGVAGFAAIVFLGGAAERFTSGLVREGYSDVSRIPIWIEAPRMAMAAPWGWGWSQSGDAYINWFQPLDRFHVPGGFLNTHLNVLVDSCWIGRVCYVFLWAFLLFCLAGRAARGRSVLPIAMFSAVFVGAVFNPIGHALTLWIVPAVVLFALLRNRPWTHGREFVVPAVLAGVATCAVLGVFAFVGDRQAKSAGMEIHGDSSHVVVNGSKADIWVVDDEQVLDGGYKGILGKDVRTWYSSHEDAGAVGFAKTLGDVPHDTRRLVLAGTACSVVTGTVEHASAAGFDRLEKLKELVLISPPFGWREVPEGVRERYRVKMVVGAFAYRLASDAEYPPEWVRVIPGCELYVPKWLGYAVN